MSREKRSSVLTRAAQDTLSTVPIKQPSNNAKTTRSFALTELREQMDSPNGQPEPQKVDSNTDSVSNDSTITDENDIDDVNEKGDKTKSGDSSSVLAGSAVQGRSGKFLLKGDPVAPLSGFRFNPSSATPLPSTVNVESVIASVMGAVKISRGLMPAWNTFFGADENQALIEDLFWYCYLKDHQERFDESTSKFMVEKIFTRMATNFVNLFRKTSPRYLDQILQKFPGALSQAVYLAFFVSCPYECLSFNGTWKTELEKNGCKMVHRNGTA